MSDPSMFKIVAALTTNCPAYTRKATKLEVARHYWENLRLKSFWAELGRSGEVWVNEPIVTPGVIFREEHPSAPKTPSGGRC